MDASCGRRARGNHAGMAAAPRDQLSQQTAHRMPYQKGCRIQRVDKVHEVVGVVTQAQRRDLGRALFQREFVMAQRRAMHGVTAFFEGGAGGSQVVPAATHSVDQNDVFDLGHTTKGDDQSAGQWP